VEHVLTEIKTWLALYGLNLLGAAVILALGLAAAGYLSRLVRALMQKAKLDQSLVGFVASLTRVALIAVVIIAALGQAGFQTASLIAVLGGAVFAVGLALQGNLSSLASGVLILIFRPFRVGEVIECGAVIGAVERIDILHTTIKCADGRTVVMPNIKLTSEAVINYSSRPIMRADVTVGVGYGDDIARAKAIVGEVVAGYDKALAEPAPQILVSELADSSVNLAVRVHVGKDDYWQAKADLLELIKLRFDREGVTIPYPQREVHLRGGQAPAAVN